MSDLKGQYYYVFVAGLRRHRRHETYAHFHGLWWESKIINACSPIRHETFPFLWHPPPALDSPLSSRMLRVSLALTNFGTEFREERPTSRVVDFHPVENTAVALIPASRAEASPSGAPEEESSHSSRSPKKDTRQSPRRPSPRPPCGDRSDFIVYGLVVPTPNFKFPIPPSDGADVKAESFGESPPPPASRGATGHPPLEETIVVNLVIAVIQDRP